MSVLYLHSWKTVLLDIQLWVDRFILTFWKYYPSVFWLPLLLMSFCCFFVGGFPFFSWGVSGIFSMVLVFYNCIIIFHLICIVTSVALSHQLQKIHSTTPFNNWLSYILFFSWSSNERYIRLSISPKLVNLFNIICNLYLCAVFWINFSAPSSNSTTLSPQMDQKGLVSDLL